MSKWEPLAIALKKEEAILAERNTPKALKALWENNLAISNLDDSGKIIVFGGLWPTKSPSFLEAGSFWVHPHFRGRGLSSWMFQELTQKIPAQKIAVCITKVGTVIHLLKKAHWQEAKKENWTEIVPFSVSCEPCDEKHKSNCSKRASPMCRMFFKLG